MISEHEHHNVDLVQGGNIFKVVPSSKVPAEQLFKCELCDYSNSADKVRSDHIKTLHMKKTGL